MKKLISILEVSLFALNVFGQVETIDTGTKSAFDSTSYEVVNSLKLTIGFQAREVVEGQFFAKIKDLYFTPATNSIAPANSNIVITFNDIMDMTNINSDIVVTGSQSGVISGVWTQNVRTLTFDPANDFLEGEIVTVDISNQLTGTTGRWTPQAYTWQFTIYLQLTYVPDNNFEQALIDLGYDDVLDDSVKTSSIKTITLLNVSSKGIGDLTGIGDFSALTTLYCYANQLSSLDVSGNVALTTLYCNNNLLTSLNLSNSTNTYLTTLYCSSNQLANLDVSKNIALTFLNCSNNPLIMGLNLSKNLALTTLYCSSNQLTSLDVSANLALTKIDCGRNQLSSLDVYSNIALESLSCYQNQLTNVNVSGNTALMYLGCSTNLLTSLDVSNNTALKTLDCFNNQLLNLDISSNTLISRVKCYYNLLTNLDVSNNTLLTTLWSYSNPNLSCIQVNPTQLANIPNKWKKDNFVSYATYCTPWTYIPDDNFEQRLIDLSYDDVLDNYVNTDDIQNITLLNLDVKGILDLTGIEDFSSLSVLSCSQNQLTNIDVSNNPALTTFICHSNQLTDLVLSNNTALINLDIANNQLTSLDVSNNTALTSLYCSSNQLSSLDVSNNTVLSALNTTSNLDLNCIQVNSSQLGAIPSGWTMDADASYSLDCTTSSARVTSQEELEVVEKELTESIPGINLYPNPANKMVTLEVEEYEGAKIEIYDLAGKLLYRSEPLSSAKTEISVEDYNEGIVLVQIIKDDGMKSFRLMIEK